MARSGRSTIHDVAARARVSATTVSHTFSGNGVVAPATRERVRAVAAELGYRPDVLARGLRSSRLGVLALVLRSLPQGEIERLSGVDYFWRFAGIAALTALECDYAVMVVADPTAPGAPGTALACDGFLLIDPLADDPLLRFLNESGIPSVTVGPAPGMATSVPFVDIWTEPIAREVLDLLVRGGARRVGVVAGTDANDWNLTTERVYREWASARGQEPLFVRMPEASGEAGGVEAARTLLAEAEPPDAVYCLTGEHALGLVGALAAAGVDVPGRMQVVCGSDLDALRSAPILVTAVDLHAEVLARTAVETLVHLLDPQMPPPVPREPGPFVHHRATTRAEA